jgi:hypothetical protein
MRGLMHNRAAPLAQQVERLHADSAGDAFQVLHVGFRSPRPIPPWRSVEAEQVGEGPLTQPTLEATTTILADDLLNIGVCHP